MKLAGPPFAAIPAQFQGVWQRTLLEGPGIATDTRSQVFWLQTDHWHGDLRLPPARPDFGACGRLDDCSAEQRGWLARQRGFAGMTQIERCSPGHGGAPPMAATYCQWHRVIDFQPPSGARDIGTLVMAGDGEILEEYGVDADYHETWHRLPDSQGEVAAWQRAGEKPGVRALLLVAGAWFIHLRERSLRFPQGPAVELAALLAASGDNGWLDMEISFGRWDRARQGGHITHSTLPWREGAELAWSQAWQPITAAGSA